MNFRKQLLADHSRANTDYIVHVIDGKQQRFEQVFRLLYDENGHVVNRAAWVLEKCAFHYPWLLKAHIDEIIDLLKVIQYDGSRRLLLKILTFFEIPDNRSGELIDMCFTWLESPKEKVALKVYSMDIISNFCLKEAGFAPEFISVLENHYERNSRAFQSKANKMIKKFNDNK